MSDADTLVALVRNAERILVFTGAGVSTGSGIRDFRGPQGVWKARQPVYFDDFLASREARIEYWDQKLEAWPSFRDARPNAAHEATVDLERAGKLRLVLTQNIDGLHSRAGTSPELRFEAATDSSNISSLFIDDVVLEVCVPGAPAAHVFSDSFEGGNTNMW